MPDIHVLHELHQLDQQILQLRARIDDVQKVLSNDDEIKMLQSVVEAKVAQATPLKKNVRTLEADMESLRAKIDETEKILYGGTIIHAKVLKDRQTELLNFQKRYAETEERLLDMMMQLDGLEEEQLTATAQLNLLIEQRKGQHQHLFDEQHQAQAHIAQLKEARLQLTPQLPPPTLKLYESLRARFKGAIVVKMQPGGVCGFCGVEQSRIIENDVRRGIGINQCNNCQRILMG